VKLEKEVRIAAPVERVWALVSDIEGLGRCIPGLEQLHMTDERHFESVVRMRVGPIGARFQLTSTLEEIEPPRWLVMETDGVDRSIAGRVRQRNSFELLPDGEQTLVRITSDIQISGRFATFGQRIIAARADQFVDEVVANVDRLLLTAEQA
jgi:carbon monoxide dehydrogenase subunit G